MDITCRKREGKKENTSGAKDLEQIKIHITGKKIGIFEYI